MNIWLYGINYAPELTGIGKYSGEMGGWLAKEGHQVKAITGFPYYPNWEVQKPYTGRWWKKEQPRKGETIIRCPLYVPQQPSALKRIVHEFSFLLSSSMALLLALFQKCDVIVCIVTPFHLGIPARLFSWLKGVPMVYHIQDLQVDAAEDLKMIKNKSLLRLMKAIERWILGKTNWISTISDGMIKKIETKGIAAQKILFFPNWVDTDFIYPLSKEDSLKEPLGFSTSDRIVLYSGNLGVKQGLENIIEVARNLRSVANLFFVIVGEGGAKDQLQQLVKADQLDNVCFFPLQDYDKLAALLAMADLHLVLQKKAASDLVMPSKLTTILAAGAAAIITAEPGSTLHEIVAQYELGLIIEPDNPVSLLQGIREALDNDLEKYKANARKYAEQYLHKDKILRAFEQQLLDMTTM